MYIDENCNISGAGDNALGEHGDVQGENRLNESAQDATTAAYDEKYGDLLSCGHSPFNYPCTVRAPSLFQNDTYREMCEQNDYQTFQRPRDVGAGNAISIVGFSRPSDPLWCSPAIPSAVVSTTIASANVLSSNEEETEVLGHQSTEYIDPHLLSSVRRISISTTHQSRPIQPHPQSRPIQPHQHPFMADNLPSDIGFRGNNGREVKPITAVALGGDYNNSHSGRAGRLLLQGHLDPLFEKKLAAAAAVQRSVVGGGLGMCDGHSEGSCRADVDVKLSDPPCSSMSICGHVWSNSRRRSRTNSPIIEGCGNYSKRVKLVHIAQQSVDLGVRGRNVANTEESFMTSGTKENSTTIASRKRRRVAAGLDKRVVLKCTECSVVLLGNYGVGDYAQCSRCGGSAFAIMKRWSPSRDN